MTDRRSFLRGAAAAGVFLLGCGDDEESDAGAGGGGSGGGLNGGAGGAVDGALGPQTFEELVPFVDEADFPLETKLNEGLDGRLYTDLSKLEPGEGESPLIDNERFYIRTCYPDLLVAPNPWVLSFRGLCVPVDRTLESFLDKVASRGAHVLECSGNGKGGSFGLMSAARWGGIALEDLFAELTIDPAATRVLIAGFDEHSLPSANNHSTPGASWIFSFEELSKAGAFLATEMNGDPLPPDHGAPVRLFVPGWYGCANIKWVNEIVFVDDAEPSTGQMREFASRTHQEGVPLLAKDFLPATMDQAAMPVRVERHVLDGQVLYRVVGILWGGYEPTNALEIRFGDGSWVPVDVVPPQTQNAVWTLWVTTWLPTKPGRYGIRMRIADPSIVTKRLDSGYYEREVDIESV